MSNFLGGPDSKEEQGTFTQEQLDAASVAMPKKHEMDTPEGKAIKAQMDFEFEFVIPQYRFWSGLGNYCRYVDGMAALEMGTDNSFQYTFKGWGGFMGQGFKAGLLPVYDTKSFIPSEQQPKEGTGFKDNFRHSAGKDWLLYGQTVDIPEKFRKFKIVEPEGTIPWVGHSPQGAVPVTGRKFRSYHTPIENWFVLFSEGVKDITKKTGFGEYNADLNMFTGVDISTSDSVKLVPGLTDIIALRKAIFHVYYPTGYYTGEDTLFWGSEEFNQNNPIFNSYGIFSQFNSDLAVSPYNWASWAKGVGSLFFDGNPNTYPYYYDHYFTMQKPYNHKNIEGSFVNKPLYVKIRPHYNFTEPGYEGVISAASVPENILPNMYVFLSETQMNNLDPSPSGFKSYAEKRPSQYLEVMTLGGALPNVFVDVLNEKGEKTGEKQKKPYFSMWTDQYNSITNQSPNTIQAYAGKLSNIGVCQSDISILNDFNDKEQMFPMAMEIEFTTDQSTEFAEMLQEHKLSKALMLEIMERTTAELAGNEDSLREEPFVHASSKQPAMIDANGNLQTDFRKPFISLNATYVETLDLDLWYKNLELTSYNKRTPANAIFMGMEEGEKTAKDMTNFEKYLLVNKFGMKYKEFIKSKFRKDFDLTLSGAREAYNETLFYRIEKKIGNQIIQNIYLPNSSETDVLKYYDTQVKYGVDYTYKIYAYQLVVGTRYAYSRFKSPTPTQLEDDYKGDVAVQSWLSGEDFDTIKDLNIPWDPWWGHAYVDYEPCAKILEIPWYEFTQTMIDHPPPPPEVDFVPYRGIKDEILINMTENNGEYLMHPVSVDSSDEKQHKLIRKALQIPKGEPILYKGDDPVIAYEIYRTKTRPKRYEDFSQNLIKTVDTIKEGTSFRDKLEPNTKYYYMIRAIDRHFHFSNPSAIFEVELLSDSIQNVGNLQELTGLTAVKPKVKIVDLDKEIEKSLFKPMRKYMRILPVMEQTMLSDEEKPKSAYDDKKVKLGLTNSPLFGGPEGRKFKIRLTSKKTGKKMDVNIDFRLKYEKMNKKDLEEHLPSLYDVAWSDIELVLDELSGNIANSILAQTARFATDYGKKSIPSRSIIEEWGMEGYTGMSPEQITAAISAASNAGAMDTGTYGSGSSSKPKKPKKKKKKKPTKGKPKGSTGY